MAWDEAGGAAGGTRRPDVMQAVAPRATYGTPADTDASRQAASSWRRRARVCAAGALAAGAVALLCLGAPGLPGASELEDVVSKPVMGTGGGPTTAPPDSGSEISAPVMGAAMLATPIDGPTVHLPPSTWKDYAIDYNVFGLHVLNGGLTDADTPGALPRGRNEWENNFDDYDFEPSDRKDSPGEQAKAIMDGVQHYGEVKFNGYPRPVAKQKEGKSPSQGDGGSTLAGGAGTTGANSALAQADSIVEGATAEQASDTAAAQAKESAAADSSGAAAAAEDSAGQGDGGNEEGGAPANTPSEEGSSANGDNAGGGEGTVTATEGGTETGPATGNNCYLLPDLCPQYSLPAPGVRGAGADVAHVDGEPKEEEENDGSQPQKHPEANITTGGILGAFVAPDPPDPPPPTPAPYTPNLVFDTSMDNGAEGMGESIQVDTSKDAVFVGGAPVAEERGRPTQLVMLSGLRKGVGKHARLSRNREASRRQTTIMSWLNGHARAGEVSLWTTGALAHGVRRIKFKQQSLAGQSLADSSGEFENTGAEDTSMDADLSAVDDKLQGVLPMYDQRVGTVNFGSRGMTDKRNDFLEGTSGSQYGSPATSAPGSKKGSLSELLGFVPTGLRVVGNERVDSQNQMLDDVTVGQDSNEFEDTGAEDTSMDADLSAVDDKLQGVLPMYDQRVGTVNFGSRGMTDKRNDFLEGTSGS